MSANAGTENVLLCQTFFQSCPSHVRHREPVTPKGCASKKIGMNCNINKVKKEQMFVLQLTELEASGILPIDRTYVLLGRGIPDEDRTGDGSVSEADNFIRCG